MVNALGMDISMNHGAIVLLKDGEMGGFWYYTNLAGSANQSKRGHRIEPDIFKTKDKHILGNRRLAWVRGFIRLIIQATKAQYGAVEDYAIRAEQGAHFLGEVGAAARLELWDAGVRYRLHDPTSVKMFVAHDGTCQKDAVERAVKKRWGADFSDVNQPPPKNGKKQNRTTSEDLADAYSIAMMVWTEYLLRNGEIRLADLHEKEVRVFNRVTKTYPISLLDREWIYRCDYE